MVFSRAMVNASPLLEPLRTRITEFQSTRFLALLRQLPIHVSPLPQPAASLTAIGRTVLTCIRGLRFPVATVVAMVADGMGTGLLSRSKNALWHAVQ